MSFGKRRYGRIVPVLYKGSSTYRLLRYMKDGPVPVSFEDLESEVHPGTKSVIRGAERKGFLEKGTNLTGDTRYYITSLGEDAVDEASD